MITIDTEIAQMGPLRSTAAALVDYIRAHAQQSVFNRYSGEWTLEPDNWINIHFVFRRRYRIHVSLGVFPSQLESQPDLKIKNGRYPNWSKISIETIRQLPSVCRCIETAYYDSHNTYRKRHGKPKRPEKT